MKNLVFFVFLLCSCQNDKNEDPVEINTWKRIVMSAGDTTFFYDTITPRRLKKDILLRNIVADSFSVNYQSVWVLFDGNLFVQKKAANLVPWHDTNFLVTKMIMLRDTNRTDFCTYEFYVQGHGVFARFKPLTQEVEYRIINDSQIRQVMDYTEIFNKLMQDTVFFPQPPFLVLRGQ